MGIPVEILAFIGILLLVGVAGFFFFGRKKEYKGKLTNDEKSEVDAILKELGEL